MTLGWGGDRRRRGGWNPGFWSSVVVGHRSARGICIVVFVWTLWPYTAQVPFSVQVTDLTRSTMLGCQLALAVKYWCALFKFLQQRSITVTRTISV